MRTYLQHAVVFATIGLIGPVVHASEVEQIRAPVAESVKEIKVFASRTCGCCKDWVAHLEKHGFSVETEYLTDMESKKNELRIPGNLRSCHTGVINGLVVEGHVPAADIDKAVHFTTVNPNSNIAGIAVPGMPHGSPGMETGRVDPYATIGFTYDGEVGVISQYGAR